MRGFVIQIMKDDGTPLHGRICDAQTTNYDGLLPPLSFHDRFPANLPILTVSDVLKDAGSQGELCEMAAGLLGAMAVSISSPNFRQATNVSETWGKTLSFLYMHYGIRATYLPASTRYPARVLAKHDSAAAIVHCPVHIGNAIKPPMFLALSHQGYDDYEKYLRAKDHTNLLRMYRSIGLQQGWDTSSIAQVLSREM